MKVSKLVILLSLFFSNQLIFCLEKKEATELVDNLAKDLDAFLKNKRNFQQIRIEEISGIVKYKNFVDLFHKIDQENHSAIAAKILQNFFRKKSTQAPHEHTKLLFDTNEMILSDVIKAVAIEHGIISESGCVVQ